MTEPFLLPCPFCGSTQDASIEKIVHTTMNEHDWRSPSWSVQCDNCTATFGYMETSEEAAAAWNARAAPVVTDQMVKAFTIGAQMGGDGEYKSVDSRMQQILDSTKARLTAGLIAAIAAASGAA